MSAPRESGTVIVASQRGIFAVVVRGEWVEVRLTKIVYSGHVDFLPPDLAVLLTDAVGDVIDRQRAGGAA